MVLLSDGDPRSLFTRRPLQVKGVKGNYRASSLSASSERAPTQEVEDLSSLSNNALQAKERIVQA